MKRAIKACVYSLCLVGLTGYEGAIAQEFPISVGNSAALGGGVYDGTNMLVSIVGTASDPQEVTAQLVSGSGSLVGSPISLGRRGQTPVVAYDGTNYLVVFGNENEDSVFGQFITPSGSLSGSTFLISDEGEVSPPKGGDLSFGGGTFMLIYRVNKVAYAQRISTSGQLSGSRVMLSEGAEVNDTKMYFDGTNFLAVWARRSDGSHSVEDIYGQFISPAGALVGSNFVIDDGQYASDNPVSIAYDGSKFFVLFHEQSAGSGSGNWNLYGKFVSTSGEVLTDRILIRDSTHYPGLVFMDFDGINFFLTWADNMFQPTSVVMGQFFDTSGTAIGTPMTVFSSLNSKFPIYGAPLYVNNQYAVFTSRVNSNWEEGDIYLKFIAPLEVGLNDEVVKKSGFDVYPNPTTGSIRILLENEMNGSAQIKVTDLSGRTVFSTELIEADHTLDLSSLPNGVYFVNLSSQYLQDVQKVVINR